jgi:aspartate racemase
VIGILSGMGAAAGAHFYSELIKAYQRDGAMKDSDFPEVVLLNIPFNGTDNGGIASETRFIIDLKRGIAKLNYCNVKKIVIVCNTAHFYITELRESSRAYIVDMIDLALKECAGHSIGVICSRTAQEDQLYGKSPLYVTAKQQVVVDKLIQRAIVGTINSADCQALLDLIFYLLSKGAEKVILGCTELPLIMNYDQVNFMPVEDIVDAGACVIKYLVEGDQI